MDLRGGRSVRIISSRTQAMEFSLVFSLEDKGKQSSGKTKI
jgi:hypothetical protein